MNYFQVTYNNLVSGYDQNHIHEVITGNATVQDWWHYLPTAYIIQTNSSLLYQSDRIRDAFPRLNFLIIKVDTKEFNGFLKKDAWEWLRKKNQLRIKYTPPVSQTLPPLNQLFSSNNTGTSSIPDLLDEILRGGRK